MSQSIYCPKCGDQNAAGAAFCKTCGGRLVAPANPEAMAPPPVDFAPPPSQPPGMPVYTSPPPVVSGPPKSNRAVIALVLGIVGLLCCGPLTAIPGIIVAKMEMDAISRGEVAPDNLGLAKAAFWVGIVVSALYVLGACAYVALIGSLAGLSGIAGL